jgi:hypothetical protein
LILARADAPRVKAMTPIPKPKISIVPVPLGDFPSLP